MGSKGQLHPFLASEEIRYDWKGKTFHVAKEKRRSPLRDDATLDLGDDTVRAEWTVDFQEFSFSAKASKESSQISMNWHLLYFSR